MEMVSDPISALPHFCSGWYAECLDWLAHPDTCDEATVKRQLKTWVLEYQAASKTP